MILNTFWMISHPVGAAVGGDGGISRKIRGDQDFSDFILFDNIRCLDDIKYLLDDFFSCLQMVQRVGDGASYIAAQHLFLLNTTFSKTTFSRMRN